MNIVMLAAGLSERMGEANKMLIDCNGISVACRSCINALEYLNTLNENSRLIVVSGYDRTGLEKSLEPCRKFISEKGEYLQMIVTYNPHFKYGQFTSAKAGVSQIPDGEFFFISLADMPFIRADHYSLLRQELKSNDCIRPVFENSPGHPVLCSPQLKKTVLAYPDNAKFTDVISNYKIKKLEISDCSVIRDIDTPQDLAYLNRQSPQ